MYLMRNLVLLIVCLYRDNRNLIHVIVYGHGILISVDKKIRCDLF